MKKSVYAVLSAFFIFSIFSCTTKIQCNEVSSGVMQFSFENLCSTELNSIFEQFLSVDENASLVSESEIQKSFENTELKISSVKVSNKADFLIEGKFDFANEKRELVLAFDPQVLKNGEISSDVNDLLEMLMAPIYTGENISKEEYLQVLSSFYGKNTIEKFAQSKIFVQIKLLNEVKSVSKSENATGAISKSGKSVFIEIPIYEILCNPQKSVFTVKY